MRSLSIGTTGMMAQQMNVDVISNNLANMGTTAFKRRRAQFHDLLYQDLRRVGSPSTDTQTLVPTGIQVGVGVKTAGIARNHSEGELIRTERELDVAINGNGYFLVEMPNGDTGYTRAGGFQLSATGEIVTTDGFTVQPSITIPADATTITINTSGEVLISQDNQIPTTTVGQFDLAIFANEPGLEAIGANIFLETAASGPPTAGIAGTAGFGDTMQHFLENSNVNAVLEITELIRAQRAYEFNSKVISTADELLSTASRLK